MADYLKLAKAPTLSHRYPECDECLVEVTSDGDGWVCPCCGTSWDYEATEDSPGTLYGGWSGETLEGTPLPTDVAWRVAGVAPQLRQQRAEELVREDIPVTTPKLEEEKN